MTEKLLLAASSALSGHKRINAVQGAARLIDAMWNGLRRPWLLIASGMAVLLLVFSARALPQLPGQLNSNPAMAARWLLGASAEYGVIGDILRTLGLFNVLHSFLLQIVLAVISLILFVHLGDLIAGLWRYQQLERLLQLPAAQPGSPIMLPTSQPIYRLRQASDNSPESMAGQLRGEFTARFGQVLTATVALASPAASAGEALAHLHEPDYESAPETRLLAMRYGMWSNLRPLLMLGLLVALLAVWLIVTRGWELAPTVLAPGETYRFTPHSLELVYQIERQGEQALPLLAARIGAAADSIVVSGQTETALAGVDILARPGPPALLITTKSGEPVLARPGQFDALASVGLTFPSPGSEESIVMPEQAVGLRFVRLADTTDTAAGPAFMLEIYRSGSPQPTKRVTIGDDQIETVLIEQEDFALQVLSLPGLDVSARYLPGAWLLWVAGVLVVVGAAGFWFRPTFILAQIAPWPEDRVVVVAQSDARLEIAALRTWLNQRNA